VIYEVYPPANVPRSKEGLDWDWIESDGNPMKTLPIRPSGDGMNDWPKKTPEEKAQIVEMYRQCGWRLR